MRRRNRDLAFRWVQWNIEHIANHGVTVEEAETVVRGARRPYPLARADDKYLVWGRGRGGRLLQVVFVLTAPTAPDDTQVVFVIHARPLTAREKKRVPDGI